jgi:hypothetical protein
VQIPDAFQTEVWSYIAPRCSPRFGKEKVRSQVAGDVCDHPVMSIMLQTKYAYLVTAECIEKWPLSL